MRLIDADKVPPLSDLRGCGYEGNEYLAYKSGAEYGRGLVDDAPTIDPKSLRPTAQWISVKDRPPKSYTALLLYGRLNPYSAMYTQYVGFWDGEKWISDGK